MRAFLQGWLFGIGFFGIGVSWVYQSLYHFGNMTMALAIILTVLFVFIMALYPAVFGYIFKSVFHKASTAIQCLMVFPSLWIIFEFLRAHLLTGFPWLFLGYTQLDTPLAGLSPIVGLYGLSFIVALFSGAMVTVLTDQKKITKLISIATIIIISLLGLILHQHQWTTQTEKPISVALVQGNISQEVKWDPKYLIQNISTYQNLTTPYLKKSQLIIWPEGAIPLLSSNAQPIIYSLKKIAQADNTTIIFGLPILKQEKYYNGLLMVGRYHGEYLKKHLVAFGEYIPLKEIFGTLMKDFKIPMSNFSKGPKNQKPLTFKNTSIAPFICYEVAFPSLVLNSAIGSGILLTISDDSWFGRSIALAQHLQMARMRALEMGRYMLVDTNTGITAIVSPLGKILKGANIDKRVVLTGKVAPMTGNTPLMMMGYLPIWLLAGLLLVLSFFRRES